MTVPDLFIYFMEQFFFFSFFIFNQMLSIGSFSRRDKIAVNVQNMIPVLQAQVLFHILYIFLRLYPFISNIKQNHLDTYM